MKHLNELLNEAYDIRNRMITEGSSVKYYTVKQSIKLLKDQLKEIESEDDKATAVYHALGDPDRIGSMDIVYGSGSKIIVKDATYDTYGKYPTDKQRQSWLDKYQQAVNAIMNDDEIESLYNKGKELWKKKLEEERKAKAEAEALAKTKAYKEFCDEYKGAHLMYKAYTLYSEWTNNNLWVSLKETIYGVMTKGLRKCKAIKSSEAKAGEFYVIVDRSGPNLSSKKDDHPMGRYNIIGELSIVKCLGDGKWNPVMVKDYSNYGEPNMSKSKVERYFDTDPYVVTVDEYLEKNEADIKRLIDDYIKRIKDDLKDNKEQEDKGQKPYYHYSSLVMSLIEKDTI
jgi:hypothetical protein